MDAKEVAKKKEELEKLKKNFDVKQVFSASSGDFGMKGILKEFMSAKDVKTKTRLTAGEVNLIARGNFISAYLREYGFERHADFLDAYHEDVMSHRISHESGSRKELGDALSSRSSFSAGLENNQINPQGNVRKTM